MDQAQLINRIIYHERAADKHQHLLDYHRQGETVARAELVRIQRQALIPQIAEFKDILGNLVARGSYVPATNEYVTNTGQKVAHWNASLYKIVPVALLRSRLYSQNKYIHIRADPDAHARHLEQQRQRYAEKHPAVERRNPFVDY
jgi:hypothetical protein